jgi:hypothetical protein
MLMKKKISIGQFSPKKIEKGIREDLSKPGPQ